MEAQLRATDLAAFLAATIADREPVLLTGAPGIGKSDIVSQAAARAGADIIISHPVVSDPTDAKGLPWIHGDGDRATFLPFGEMAAACRATRPTVWFLDDLGQAAPAVQASFMQLLLARRVNGHALPDCVTFIAATNRRTDRAGVTGILEPVKSRFTGSIIELVPHVDDWSRWALNYGQPAELIAFLRFRPDLLAAFSPTADLTNSPTPRTWSAVGRMMGRDLPEHILAAAYAGLVGSAAATEFSAFLRLYRQMPSVDAILTDPDAVDIPTEPSALYAVVTALGMRTNVRTFGRIARYAERLTDASRGEFGALLLRDALRRDQAVTQTPEYVRLAAGPLGALIGGNL